MTLRLRAPGRFGELLGGFPFPYPRPQGAAWTLNRRSGSCSCRWSSSDLALGTDRGRYAFATSGGSANAILFPSGSGMFTWRTPFEWVCGDLSRLERGYRERLLRRRQSLRLRQTSGVAPSPGEHHPAVTGRRRSDAHVCGRRSACGGSRAARESLARAPHARLLRQLAAAVRIRHVEDGGRGRRFPLHPY